VRIALQKVNTCENISIALRGINNLNKDNKALWEFTYRILHEEKERVRVVNKNPDNLLVSWVPGVLLVIQAQIFSNSVHTL
jgi:hypothetical protein